MVHTTIVPGDSDSRGVDSTLLESCFGMAWREVRRTRSSAAAAAAIDQKAEQGNYNCIDDSVFRRDQSDVSGGEFATRKL
jgi:hypothetical protein